MRLCYRQDSIISVDLFLYLKTYRILFGARAFERDGLSLFLGLGLYLNFKCLLSFYLFLYYFPFCEMCANILEMVPINCPHNIQ